MNIDLHRPEASDFSAKTSNLGKYTYCMHPFILRRDLDEGDKAERKTKVKYFVHDNAFILRQHDKNNAF